MAATPAAKRPAAPTPSTPTTRWNSTRCISAPAAAAPRGPASPAAGPTPSSSPAPRRVSAPSPAAAVVAAYPEVLLWDVLFAVGLWAGPTAANQDAKVRGLGLQGRKLGLSIAMVGRGATGVSVSFSLLVWGGGHGLWASAARQTRAQL